MNNNYIDTIYDEKSHPVTSYPDQLAVYLRDRFKIGGTLLDVGCGRGDFLRAFQRAGFDAKGIEGEERDEEQNVIGGVNLESDTIPIKDSTVDVVFTKSVLEHIHQPDKMMEECYRVLKPGGRIIAMVPDWQTCMYIYYDDHTHVQPYTVNGLRDLLKIFQYRDVISEQFYQLPIIWKYPSLKIVSKGLQMLGPVKKISKNKFYRWSRELMVLASGIK